MTAPIDEDDAYELDDPKHPTWLDRLLNRLPA